ncbi:hypothetical protein ISCGN_031963 [Ixodes scapularis]
MGWVGAHRPEPGRRPLSPPPHSYRGDEWGRRQGAGAYILGCRAPVGSVAGFPPHQDPAKQVPRPPYDAGTPFVQAQSTVAAHADPRGSHTARQRLFTVTDPPTRRDIAEAFIFVQQVARHSQHIGRREIQELQLLELFVDIWDCRCIGLPPRSKLRVFDRVRLLYHVALSGGGAALDGYADPSATFLLGPPAPRRVATHRGGSPDRSVSPPRGTLNCTDKIIERLFGEL